MAFPGVRKAILALLGLVSSLVAGFQQTYFLLDLHTVITTDRDRDWCSHLRFPSQFALLVSVGQGDQN